MQRYALFDFKPAELDLQPFWHSLDDDALAAFARYFPAAKYAAVDNDTANESGVVLASASPTQDDDVDAEYDSGLRNVNLSWSGVQPGVISSLRFAEFAATSCRALRTLSVSSCRFVDADVLNAVVRNCAALERLEVASCASLDAAAFCCLADLKRLTVLNAYRTRIDGAAFKLIFAHCAALRCVNVGACAALDKDNVDELLAHVADARCAPQFRAFDFWRLRTLTDKGVATLAEHFPALEELDVWLDQRGRNAARLSRAFR